jgi:iron complex transport system permease protein
MSKRSDVAAKRTPSGMFAQPESARADSGLAQSGHAAAARTVPVSPRGLAPLWLGAAVAFLLVSVATGILVGPIDLGLGGVLRSVADRLGLPVSTTLTPTEESILWEIRMPRVVLAALVGGMLAMAGATYQGVFRNPLADPYLLGVAAGAGLGATLAIAYLPGVLSSDHALPAAAFVGGSVAVVLTYSIGRSAGRERDAATLVLAGVTVASFFTALQTFAQQQNADTLQQVYTWILGSIPNTGWSDVVLILPYLAAAAAVILLLRRVVDVLTLGDDEAESLGVNVRRVRLVLVAAATIGTAAAVAVCGLIGFVGIIVPHAIRMLAGTGYRALLPLSFVAGAGFLVFADVISRTALAPAEIPLGIVTAFFGAPFFALVLRTTRGGRG